MKKKIAFVIPSLDAGGGEKSLINLLNTIDFNCFEVDVIVFQAKGLFLSSLPNEVHLIPIQGDYASFTLGIPKASLIFLKQGKLGLIFHRIIYTLKNKFITNKSFAEQSSWKNLSKSIAKFSKKYDVAIGFLEKSSNYLAIDKLNATQKIGWIHTNYSKSRMDPSFDLPYFEKMDAIVTVSKECENDLRQNFPFISAKFKVIHNIISPKLIQQLVREPIAISLDWKKINIVTVARLSHEKGCDMALEACKILVEKGLDIFWVIIGDGSERTNLQNKIKQYQLQSNFVLAGLQSNPYPFIQKATIYVQPSRYEGKSIAIDEVKIINKPIIVTNFDTAKDQINHLHNGIICPINPNEIAETIENLMNDEALQEQLRLNLSKEKLDSENEIQKFYSLMYD